jgi:predicted membrane protein (TIGR00267 family)
MKKFKGDGRASLWKDFILGGQDGLVEVLGLSLALGVATGDSRIIIIAGLAATFSESISMGAVAFTSSEAENDYYNSINMSKSLSRKIIHPLKSAWIVLLASIIGSLIPLLPFFFLGVSDAMVISVIVTALALFGTGALQARSTSGDWKKKGLRLMVIGLFASFIGFLIGWASGFFKN